jgi:hypothetical protein
MVVLMPAPLCGMSRVMIALRRALIVMVATVKYPVPGGVSQSRSLNPIMIMYSSIPWMAPKTVVPHSATARRRSDGDRELPGCQAQIATNRPYRFVGTQVSHEPASAITA